MKEKTLTNAIITAHQITCLLNATIKINLHQKQVSIFSMDENLSFFDEA
jgi:phospholipase/lecithinase/hemolysin